MKDQLSHWNNAHAQQWLHKHSLTQTQYAIDVEDSLADKSNMLELGCGEGNDSIFFAEKGHVITSTDFSDVVIEQNKKQLQHANLRFEVQDTSKKFNYSDGQFDAIYARLSLHYFPNETTIAIFDEMRRVLKPSGNLYFMCKSVDDLIYGQGIELEKDMYELNGHVRHFFSEDYAKQLLTEASFDITSIIKGEEKIYDRQSAYIQVEAKAI
jgi:ubiquinone/menaquinone biosynthesis C-methylase UbiE